MSLSDQQWTFLQNTALLIAFCATRQIKLTGGELYRTQEQQDLHYAAKRSKVKHSRHQDRLAVDFNIFIDNILVGSNPTEAEFIELKLMADYWHCLHADNVCGYDWSWDYNHFEMKN